MPESPALSTPSNAASGSDREHAVPTGLFIGGTWRPAASGAALPVDDPATGKTLVDVANARTGGRARSAGRRRRRAARFRGDAAAGARGDQRRAYALMTARIDDLALLMTLEMGKPRPSGSVC